MPEVAVPPLPSHQPQLPTGSVVTGELHPVHVCKFKNGTRDCSYRVSALAGESSAFFTSIVRYLFRTSVYEPPRWSAVLVFGHTGCSLQPGKSERGVGEGGGRGREKSEISSSPLVARPTGSLCFRPQTNTARQKAMVACTSSVKTYFRCSRFHALFSKPRLCASSHNDVALFGKALTCRRCSCKTSTILTIHERLSSRPDRLHEADFLTISSRLPGGRDGDCGLEPRTNSGHSRLCLVC